MFVVFHFPTKSVLWGKKKKVWARGGAAVVLLWCRSLTVTVQQSTLWGENQERTNLNGTQKIEIDATSLIGGLFAGGVITGYCTVYAVP
jgi:hypothetical protein